MAQAILAEEEYYHVVNRGVRKDTIFHDKRDYARFLYLILHFQGEYSSTNVGRSVTHFIKTGSFGLRDETLKKIIQLRTVELVAFCLMPNHFHLELKQIGENSISKYMQRVLGAYAKYYNEKYAKTGHVFQGKFRRVLVENNNQLLHLSAYIHKNPSELPGWRKREHEYEWSSLQDYVGDNRWGKLLANEVIMEQFDNKNEYLQFIRTSSAKEVDNLLILDVGVQV